MDGTSYHKSSTVGTLGRTLAGGVLMGGVGAIVGGTTAKKKVVDTVETIDIKLTIDSLTNPILELRFFDLKTKRSSPFFKLFAEDAEKWAGIFDVIVRRNSKNPKI